MARIGQGPVGGDLPGGVGATDRSGRHGTSVAAALPRAWMVDKVLAAVLARDARHRRRKVTYFRSPEHQETDSASSRNMLNLLVGPIHRKNCNKNGDRAVCWSHAFLQSTGPQVWLWGSLQLLCWVLRHPFDGFGTGQLLPWQIC